MAAIATVGGLAWMKAVDVSLWMRSVATVEAVKDVSDRVKVLEDARQLEMQREFDERAATVDTLRAMAGDAAAAAAKKNPGAGEAARAKFNKHILNGVKPLVALELVLHEYGAIK